MTHIQAPTVTLWPHRLVYLSLPPFNLVHMLPAGYCYATVTIRAARGRSVADVTGGNAMLREALKLQVSRATP